MLDEWPHIYNEKPQACRYNHTVKSQKKPKALTSQLLHNPEAPHTPSQIIRNCFPHTSASRLPFRVIKQTVLPSLLQYNFHLEFTQHPILGPRRFTTHSQDSQNLLRTAYCVTATTHKHSKESLSHLAAHSSCIQFQQKLIRASGLTTPTQNSCITSAISTWPPSHIETQRNNYKLKTHRTIRHWQICWFCHKYRNTVPWYMLAASTSNAFLQICKMMDDSFFAVSHSSM